MDGYIELTLTNDRGPICFPIGGFTFSIHSGGGTMVYAGGQGWHVDEAYEYIIATLSVNAYVARAPNEND